MQLDALPTEIIRNIAEHNTDEPGIFVDEDLLSLILTSKHFYSVFQDKIQQHAEYMPLRHFKIDRDEAEVSFAAVSYPLDLTVELQRRPILSKYIRRLSYTAVSLDYETTPTQEKLEAARYCLEASDYLKYGWAQKPDLLRLARGDPIRELAVCGRGLSILLSMLPNLRNLHFRG